METLPGLVCNSHSSDVGVYVMLWGEVMPEQGPAPIVFTPRPGRSRTRPRWSRGLVLAPPVQVASPRLPRRHYWVPKLWEMFAGLVMPRKGPLAGGGCVRLGGSPPRSFPPLACEEDGGRRSLVGLRGESCPK